MQQIASFDMTDQDKLGATPWKALPLKVEKERQTYRYCRQVPVAAFPEELPARLVPFTSANSSSSGIMELRRYLYWVDTLHSQLSERQRLVRRFPTLTPLLSRPCVAAKPPLDPPVVPPSLLSHPMGPPRAAGFQFPSTPKPSRPPDSKWLYGTAHSCVVRPDLRDVAPVEKRRVSFIG
ncbi:MAG: hypothetical protein KVP17_002797 [Porospora cf. gigantea B]|nr:MAG: hypothetical protein KVP17_002797 [Porospora cf. gigantea B]